jgi:hypothetical protein
MAQDNVQRRAFRATKQVGNLLTTEETHSSVTVASRGILAHGMQKMNQPVSHLQ